MQASIKAVILHPLFKNVINEFNNKTFNRKGREDRIS